jgi:predicted aspartyl protease
MRQLAKYFAAAIFTCIGLHASPFGLLPASARTSVPFRTVNGSILVLRVSLNGQGPYDFMFDTGTNTSLVDSALVASLGLSPVDRVALSTLTGTTAVPRYFLETLSLGGAKIQQVEVLTEDLRALQAIDQRIRGILGLSALREYSFLIDNEHKRLDLFSDEEAPQFPKGAYTPIEVVRDCILIPVASRAARGGTLKLGLDSGVSQFVVREESVLSRGTSSAGYGESLRPVGYAQSMGTMQVTTNLSKRYATIVRIDSLDVGPVRFTNIPVVVLGTKMPAPPPGEDGLLPVSLFRLIFFDRKTSRLLLEPK